MTMTAFWFWMDVFWMFDNIRLSTIVATFALFIGLIILSNRLFLAIKNWNKLYWNTYVGNIAIETSILCWFIMNLCWMLEMKNYGVIALGVGLIAFISSAALNGFESIKKFKRFRKRYKI